MDNRTIKDELIPEWSLSMYFELINEGKKLKGLFDVGPDIDLLIKNAERLNLRLEELDLVAISHMHWDHTLALNDFLERFRPKRLLLPDDKKNIKPYLKTFKNTIIAKRFLEVLPGIYTSGTLKASMKEQALGVMAQDRLFVMVGCSHPGVDALVKVFQQNLNVFPEVVVGGYHIKTRGEGKNIASKLKDLKVNIPLPCHCTGDPAINAIQDTFNVKSRVSVGTKILMAEDGTINIEES